METEYIKKLLLGLQSLKYETSPDKSFKDVNFIDGDGDETKVTHIEGNFIKDNLYKYLTKDENT